MPGREIPSLRMRCCRVVRFIPRRTAAPSSPRKHDTLDEAERKHIVAVLKDTHWVLSGPNGAAVRLGMKRTTLQHRMRRLGIFRAGM